MSASGETIRHVDEHDADAILALLAALGHPSTPERVRRQVSRGSTLGSWILVADVAGIAVGFAAFQIGYRFAEDERFCQLSAISVTKEERRRGLGRRLVEAVEEAAVDAECVQIRINCGLRPEREAAHRLYKRLGYNGVGGSSSIDYEKALPR